MLVYLRKNLHRAAHTFQMRPLVGQAAACGVCISRITSSSVSAAPLPVPCECTGKTLEDSPSTWSPAKQAEDLDRVLGSLS